MTDEIRYNANLQIDMDGPLGRQAQDWAMSLLAVRSLDVPGSFNLALEQLLSEIMNGPITLEGLDERACRMGALLHVLADVLWVEGALIDETRDQPAGTTLGVLVSGYQSQRDEGPEK